MSTKYGQQSTKGMPAVVDKSVEVRERRTRDDTERDVGRFGSSAWRNTLRPVSLLDCIAYNQVKSLGICMKMSTRRSLPLLIYSGEVGLQGKYHIWYYIISNTSCSLAVHANSAMRRSSWSCGLGHLWWCGLSCGYRGHTPTASPRAPCILWEHRLELVRADQRAANH
jgi:hypothetical protein